MGNRRTPQVGDKVILINCKKAESKCYKDKELRVKQAPFVFDRDIVAEVENVKSYVPVRNLEIVKYCD